MALQFLWILACLALFAHASPLESSSRPLFSRSFVDHVHSFLKRRPALPGLPGNDPWYAPPANLAAAQPGDILKWRPAPRPLSTDNMRAINVQAMYQIQYRTQNSKGAPIANVLTAIVPHNARTDALFSYIYFSDVPNPNCNPSLSMTLETNVAADWVKQQMGPIIAALSQGWIVAVPDDGGPQASFPSGLNMAYNTLDSMRAMLRSQAITGLQPGSTITLNGYSGGGIAAGWTGEMHPIYAPDLKIDGIALGGLVPDFVYLSDLIKSGQGMFRWGPVAYAGLSHDYPELTTWLDQNLKPETAAEFWNVENLCIEASSQFYGQRNTCDYFTRGCAALDDALPSNILREATTMGLHGTPSAPWYLYATVADEVSPINLTRALFDKYCSQGATIQFEETQLPLAHAVVSVSGFPGALKFMMDRHARLPLPWSGCRKVDISPESIQSIWPFSIITPFYQTLLAENGIPVGQFWFS